MESVEHKTIKDTVCKKLQEWFGASIPEYPSSGHELDVFAVTPDGISIGVEVIWSPTASNFYRCLSLIQQSDARVKVVISNPEIILNQEYSRQFSKAAIAQRRTGILIHGELINGRRILEDPTFIENEFKRIIFDLVQNASRERMKEAVEISLPEIPKPDKIKEQLIPNLFPVKSYPSKIFSAPTDLRTETEVFRKLGSKIGEYPFILKSKKIYTFHNLGDPSSPFKSIILTKNIVEESVDEWIRDGPKRNDLVRLLNLSLRIYCKKRNLYYDRDHKRYFCLPKEYGKDYGFLWRPETKIAERALVKWHYEGGKVVYCEHQAASLMFMFLDNQLFLKIEPTITFTSDGKTPLSSRRLIKLLSRRLPRQYNDSYLKLVKFWAKYLSRRDVVMSIPAGEQKIEIGTTPIEIPVNVGIVKEDLRSER